VRRRPSITFAVLGRNEARWLPTSLGQALEAAEPEDRVLFADGGSTDGSADVAASMRVDVLSVPTGKGRAVAEVLRRSPLDHVCFLDADIEASDRNIPLTLAEGLRASGADMVVAEFDWLEKRFMVNGTAIYDPLVGALFPEAVGRYGRLPFSGFRLVDARRVMGPIPPGWGVELHLNVSFAAAGLSTHVVDIGRYVGPIRDKVGDSVEFAAAILDQAQRIVRLDPAQRPAWDDWVERVAVEIRTWPGSDVPADDPRIADFHSRVSAAAARPLPPALRS
jgi:glucosyl-3-phosphoglycerate synthase